MAILAFTGLVTGCTSTEDERPCVQERCAYDEAACMRRIADVVACQMEVETHLPPVRYYTAAEVVAEWEAEREPLDEATQRLQDDWRRAQALVALLPADEEPSAATAASVQSLGGFYDTETDVVTIVVDNILDDGDLDDMIVILAHEMVHAHQHRHRNLTLQRDLHASTTDRALGHRALTEGEAELYESFADLDLRGLPVGRVDWAAYFDGYQEWALDEAMTAERPASDQWSLFPYAFGVQLAWTAWSVAGPPMFDLLYARPPDSVRQAMHGFGAWRAATRGNADASFDPEAVPVLPDGFTYVSGAHAGVWQINATLQRTGTPPASPWSAALDDVTADYMTVYRADSTGELALVWRIRTASAAAASSLSALFTEEEGQWQEPSDAATHTDPRVVSTIDGDVLLVATTPGLHPVAIYESILGWQSPEAAAGETPSPASRRSPPWRHALELASRRDRAVLGP